jgi:hypothetical protein
MLGARYSMVLCVCSHCTCTSLVLKLSITATSATSARLFVWETASCFEYPAMLGTRYSILMYACSYCTCTSRVHKLSITAPPSTSVRLFVWAVLQQLRASSILLCSAHTILSCCARAVTAHALLVVISCLLQLRRLLQYGFSFGPLGSSFVLRISCYARRTLFYFFVRVHFLHRHFSC